MSDSFANCTSHNCYYRHKKKKSSTMFTTPFSSPSTAFFSPPKASSSSSLPLLRTSSTFFHLRSNATSSSSLTTSGTSSSSSSSSYCSPLAFYTNSKKPKEISANMASSSVSSRTFLNARDEQGIYLSIFYFFNSRFACRWFARFIVLFL